MEIIKDNYNTVVFEATETESFQYHIFREDGSILEGNSKNILKSNHYEYCEPIYFNAENNLLFIKGEGKIFIVDAAKKKLKKTIKGVNITKLYKNKQLFYTNKYLKVYYINLENSKVKKALKMKGYAQILSNNKYIYFVNKGLWLYKRGEKREVFSGLFPKVEKYNISPLGKMLAFSNGNKLIFLPLN